MSEILYGDPVRDVISAVTKEWKPTARVDCVPS